MSRSLISGHVFGVSPGSSVNKKLRSLSTTTTSTMAVSVFKVPTYKVVTEEKITQITMVYICMKEHSLYHSNDTFYMNDNEIIIILNYSFCHLLVLFQL